MIIHVKNKHTLKVDEFYFKCSVGKNGSTHNKKEGEAEIYYPSGYLNMKCNYHSDKLHGVAEFYYDKTNQLESQGLYTLGLQDSIWVFYNELGDTLDLYDYVNRRSLMIE